MSEQRETVATVQTLIQHKIASRIHAKDASVYDFSEAAESYSAGFMGWTDLASNPPVALEAIQSFADSMVNEHVIKTVVLIGEGGSTQAPMTITKYHKPDGNRVDFRTLESDSPVRLRELLAEIDPTTTLVILSSKSGGTIEPRMLLLAVRQAFSAVMDEAELVKHLAAITDPGSDLEHQAQEEGWAAIFSGEPTVGGRFSALSVFGLVPAALAGIDLSSFVARAREAEELCASDSDENPAIQLAAFLYDQYEAGRDKFSFVTTPRGRVLGLWIEQLIAESLGKDGKGILPSMEVNTLLLSQDYGDRSVITTATRATTWDEANDFQESLEVINPSLPRMDYALDGVEDLVEAFLMWEYATAMLGYLMQVSPFDQPDVASAKAVVKDILRDGAPEPDVVDMFTEEIDRGECEIYLSSDFADCDSLLESLFELFNGIESDDYFSLNAFLPFTGEGRREALESIRHDVSQAFGIVASLEIGPRYLHSVGQLQKGGPNRGVYLIVSAEEPQDVTLPDGADAPSLGTLAKTQALGDQITLADRGRRCVMVHLPDNSGTTLRCLVNAVRDALQLVGAQRMMESIEALEGTDGLLGIDDLEYLDLAQFDDLEDLDDIEESE